MDLIGKNVHHQKWGVGVVESIADGKVLVKFSEREVPFQYPDAFMSFLSLDDNTAQQVIAEEAKISVAKREEEKERERVERDKRVQEDIKKPRKEKKKGYQSGINHQIWIKFEGPQKENQPHETVEVNKNGKAVYILNYRKRPAVHEGDEVYVAAGIVDDNGISQQSIIGRGLLHEVSESDVLPEWIEKYNWMEHYHYYAELVELEVLDAPRSKGLYLDQVIKKIGSDTFEASYGEERTYEQLRIIHTQKQHMKLTVDAKEYIDEEFDRLVKLYGSRKYTSP